ncbi:flagellar biosynthetic protein FlhB [bacterium BMS3Abin03]|nr:flagellar biosynthetic protein FlhB [bacterium BMS3Abin03]
MPEVDGQEKTEKATPKKLLEGREKGQVAKSVEINSLAIFTIGLLLLYITKNLLSTQFATLAKLIFSSLDTLSINLNNITLFINKIIFFFLTALAPVFITMIVVALTVSFIQVGFKISPKALEPKLSKFNVLKGVKNIFFSSRSIVEATKSLFKLFIIGGFAYFILNDYVNQSSKLVELTVAEIVGFMLNAAYSLVWKVAILFAALAGLDYVYQRYKFNKDMMMTKQEIKEETKQTEGDPVVKRRIRQIQHETSRKRMMQNVPDADVVITNPEHYAVALKYEMDKESAPKVVAKGADTIAQRIKSIAKEHGIPIHENKELARALYKYCDVGELIPQELFQSVASVLAYIYRLRRNKKRRNII